MLKIFNSHIKSACVLVVMLGLAMLHLPDFTNQSDYESFKNWIQTQITNDFNKNVTDSDQSSRFELSPDFIRHIKKVLHEKATDSAEPVDASTLQYLYLAWSQFYSASDMAGTFSNERINPGRYLNILPQHPAILVSSTFKVLEIKLTEVISVQDPKSNPARYLTEPAISGMSIHAP